MMIKNTRVKTGVFFMARWCPVKNIFEKESADYVCEEINDSEFQYVIYFRDANIDEYKYCFTFDIMGSYYHRLIDYDFETIIHHNCNVGH